MGAASFAKLDSRLAECTRACLNGHRHLCREKNLEKTIKEARLKAKKEATKKDNGFENACDEDLDKLEADFFDKTGAAA